MKKIVFLFFAMVSIATSSAQTKAAGVTLPNNVSFEGEKTYVEWSWCKGEVLDGYVCRSFIPRF